MRTSVQVPSNIVALLLVITSCGEFEEGVPPALAMVEPVADALGAYDYQVLNILGRWRRSNGDYMTTTDPAEQPGGVFEGQIFYSSQQSGYGFTKPIYRLYNTWDHMESGIAGEAGYTTEQFLGYMATSSSTGLCNMRRWFKFSNGDHLSSFCNEAPVGYAGEVAIGYSFYRHGLNCELPYSVTGGAVTLRVNQVAGGTVSELWWGGRQFVNNWDYGRQIQIAINLLPDGSVNPTEGGDQYGCPGVTTAGWAHGSPLIALSGNGTAASPLQTTTIPLMWTPEAKDEFGNPRWPDGGSTHPVLWRGGVLSKSLVLNFQNRPRIIKWTTILDFYVNQNFLDAETLTAYLRNEYSNYYTFDTTVRPVVATSFTANLGAGCQYVSVPTGGIIFGTTVAPQNSHALGVYYGTPNALPAICNFSFSGGGGKYGGGTNKFSVRYGINGPYGPSYGTGSLVVDAYLIVGSVADILVEATWLSDNGY